MGKVIKMVAPRVQEEKQNIAQLRHLVRKFKLSPDAEREAIRKIKAEQTQ